MPVPRTIKAIAFALAGTLLFWLGRWSYSRNVIVYSNHGYRVTAHLDGPTSGLPLAEYSSLLTELRAGLTNEAMAHMEFLLDGAVLGAMSRRPHLPPSGTEQLDKALSWVARYREKFPRPTSTMISPESPDDEVRRRNSQGWIKGRQSLVERELEVDRYLEEFRSRNRIN